MSRSKCDCLSRPPIGLYNFKILIKNYFFVSNFMMTTFLRYIALFFKIVFKIWELFYEIFMSVGSTIRSKKLHWIAAIFFKCFRVVFVASFKSMYVLLQQTYERHTDVQTFLIHPQKRIYLHIHWRKNKENSLVKFLPNFEIDY